MTEETDAPAASRKAYHHGGLRQALIDATAELVRERGEENFTLADACRAAGVSTAAPYRHFADKDEILGEVAAQGFVSMTDRAKAAASAFPKGSADRILRVGEVYVAFAVAEQALFRLMFGQKPGLTRQDHVIEQGKACFGYVLQEVIDYCDVNRIEGNATTIAVQLWTLVHGVASLTIEGNYKKVVPDQDVASMMTSAAEKLLFSLRGSAR